MPDIEVLDSTMHYEEAGEGAPIVFLHGNPTSSFVWRNVIPSLASEGRCLAPDLIGMGRSGKPDIDYRFVDHAYYLDAWIRALELDYITFVGHEWGAALAFHWASRHPDRVAGVAFFEAIIRADSWDQWEWPGPGKELLQEFRTPDKGEELILDRNLFIEALLPAGTVRPLTEEEMDAYRAPYVERAARRPMLQWARELPIDGEPADVASMMRRSHEWLATSEDVPKLLLTAEPGIVVGPPTAQWCRDTIASLEVESLGPGLHHLQGDHPEAIAGHVAGWRRRQGIWGELLTA